MEKQYLIKTSHEGRFIDFVVNINRLFGGKEKVDEM